MVTIHDISKEKEYDNYGSMYGTKFFVSFTTDIISKESICTLEITDFGWASYEIHGGYEDDGDTIETFLRNEYLYMYNKIRPNELKQIYFILAEIIGEVVQTEDVESIFTQLQAIGGLDL